MIDDVTFRQSYERRETEGSGVTLVAFYNDTMPRKLLGLVHRIQDGLLQCLIQYPELVHPYEHWAHATLCGMEGRLSSNGKILIDNMVNRAETLGEPTRPFAINGFLDFVRTHAWPMSFQFGGYGPNHVNPYDSERNPLERSFAVRSDGLAVLMGWPLHASGQLFAPHLYQFRQALHPFGVVHKYHCRRAGVDNDLFTVTAGLNYSKWQQLTYKEQQEVREKLTEFQKKIRTFLQSNRIVIHLKMDQVWIIKYSRITLEDVAFAKKISEVSMEDIYRLYTAE